LAAKIQFRYRKANKKTWIYLKTSGLEKLIATIEKREIKLNLQVKKEIQQFF
jgi:hypothetical protein